MSKEIIDLHRKWIAWSDDDYESDQMLKKPQPPLVKAPMGGKVTPLPRNFDELEMQRDILRVMYARRSHRVYTEGTISLPALSFMIWAQQGVRGLRGKKYATLRTVPSGGARHAFELYMCVYRVEGLESGMYHYLPMEHAVEFLRPLTDADAQDVPDSVCGQKFVMKSSVIFYYSAVPYRAEWRYDIDAHRVMLIDAGHITQNLYLACGALGLGTCAIAAVDGSRANRLFGLDGVEEFVFYCAPVGSIDEKNEDAEQAFYAFLRDE